MSGRLIGSGKCGRGCATAPACEAEPVGRGQEISDPLRLIGTPVGKLVGLVA
jgi:hypothetical protein